MIRPAWLIAATLFAQAQPAPIDRISAASLREHVSFLASDALQGRDTPSPGLDTAAEYIASAFRRAGLESPPGDSYSQDAPYLEIAGASETSQFTLSGFAPVAHLAVINAHAAHLTNEPVFKWAPGQRIAAPLSGKILMLRSPPDPATVAKLALSRPDAIVELTPKTDMPAWRAPRLVPVDKQNADPLIVIHVPESEMASAFNRLPPGLTHARASLQVAEPIVNCVRLRNMVGILPGSDPQLRGQYVLVSAHYDHLGVADTSDSDRIFNGANDNASGVASIIELARALAQAHPRPARTVVFLCFFGEEKGLLGSTWYVKHPLFPLARTVADINLEQLGEPDSDDELTPGSIGATGYAFTDLPRLLAPAFQSEGVTLRDAPDNVDFYDRSDNLPFAQAGIPTHTFAAAFTFPDYHLVSDEWPKLDYENLAKLNCGLAAAILALANSAESPKWSEGNKQTREYAKAWHALHP